MLKIENTEVMGWEHAIRGMRNPKNSWEKSDSGYCDTIGDKFGDVIKPENYRLGSNDFDLMSRLRNAGTDHRKFMRMITVYLDITAPLYWWKEFDTYKVGTVANSCSTMHKIADKEFTLDDFSYEHLNCEPYHRNWIESATVDEDITSPHKVWMTPLDILRCTIEMLNAYRESYLFGQKPTFEKIFERVRTIFLKKPRKSGQKPGFENQKWAEKFGGIF